MLYIFIQFIFQQVFYLDVLTRRPTIADEQFILNKTENYLLRKSYDDLNELMYFVRSNYKKEGFIDNFQKQIRYFNDFLQILYIRKTLKFCKKNF